MAADDDDTNDWISKYFRCVQDFSSNQRPMYNKNKYEEINTEPYIQENSSSFVSRNIRNEPMSEDETPQQQQINLIERRSIKREYQEEDTKEEMQRIPIYSNFKDDDLIVNRPIKKVKNYTASKEKIKQKTEPSSSGESVQNKKGEEESIWKWWEEEVLDESAQWNTLSHNGPCLPEPYERVPENVKFYYDGKHMRLSKLTEEVAGLFGRIKNCLITSNDVFKSNFFKDWRKVMTPEEKAVITDLSKCNFEDFYVYYKQKYEEKRRIYEPKKERYKLIAEYGYCIIDGAKQRIQTFKIPSPTIFMGCGVDPKAGMLKQRIEAEDIVINIGKEAKVPEPPPGHKWKEVCHNNRALWTISWNDNIIGTQYNSIKPRFDTGKKDWQKYETARKLKSHVYRVREEYMRDFKSNEMKVRQQAVALYFIDKLGFRAGVQDEDNMDTIDCFSLHVEHITLNDEKDGQEYVVSYEIGPRHNKWFKSVEVEKTVYRNLQLFMENKKCDDVLFDQLNPSILNEYLNERMNGLTSKVFRAYNASNALQQQLNLLNIKGNMSTSRKMSAYDRANVQAAILCNYEILRKHYYQTVKDVKIGIEQKEARIAECKKELIAFEKSSTDEALLKKKKKLISRLTGVVKHLKMNTIKREENKYSAGGKSRFNFLDPRVSVAWCKKWGIPIDMIYTHKKIMDKNRWAIEMAGAEYQF